MLSLTWSELGVIIQGHNQALNKASYGSGCHISVCLFFFPRHEHNCTSYRELLNLMNCLYSEGNGWPEGSTASFCCQSSETSPLPSQGVCHRTDILSPYIRFLIKYYYSMAFYFQVFSPLWSQRRPSVPSFLRRDAMCCHR